LERKYHCEPVSCESARLYILFSPDFALLCVWPIHLTLILLPYCSSCRPLGVIFIHLYSEWGAGTLIHPQRFLITTSSNRKGLRTFLNIHLPYQLY